MFPYVHILRQRLPIWTSCQAALHSGVGWPPSFSLCIYTLWSKLTNPDLFPGGPPLWSRMTFMFLSIHYSLCLKLTNLDVLPSGPPFLEQLHVSIYTLFSLVKAYKFRRPARRPSIPGAGWPPSFYLYIFTLWSKLTNLDVLPGGPPLLEQDDLHVPLRHLHQAAVPVRQVHQRQRQVVLKKSRIFYARLRMTCRSHIVFYVKHVLCFTIGWLPSEKFNSRFVW